MVLPLQSLPLKKLDGDWAITPEAKASLFADIFAGKGQLPELLQNEYSDRFSSIPTQHMSGFLPVRVRNTKKVLKNLDKDSATGPDLLSAFILKACADSLAYPVTLLARGILRGKKWPEYWRLHWIHPLHKKKSKAEGGNYRGIHLTSQLSKVLERILGTLFLPFLEKTDAFGLNQFAYRKDRGLRDALAFNVASWIHLFHTGKKVGLHCADVSGAFDRVARSRLVTKLQRSGMHNDIIEIICSWLEARQACVVVDGETYPLSALLDSIYQGTV